jgi:hypothetical protein
VIAAGNAAIGALAGGDVEISAPRHDDHGFAAKGLPVAIIGTFGPGSWKLVAHPGTRRKDCAAKPSASAARNQIEFATCRAPSNWVLPGKGC